MARLRAEYDAIQQAMNRISAMNDEAQSALNTLNGTVMEMMDNWEGLAGHRPGTEAPAHYADYPRGRSGCGGTFPRRISRPA
jgi:hypothetical protein